MSNQIEIISNLGNNSSIGHMDAVIKLATNNQLNNKAIAKLATILSESGENFTFSGQGILADIPSTGGPSSLSTLICPLILNELGFIIPKLGIKGRPAGAIDVLAQLDNYKIDFEIDEINEILKSNRYCHFISNNKYAPLDAKLFEHRAKNNAKAISPLVIASILSKKLAVNLKKTGLDIRVFSGGNFGKTYDESVSNGRRFIAVAKLLGIESKCYINDFSVLKQPYIGRGESILAIKKIIDDQMPSLLEHHYKECVKMCMALTDEISSIPDKKIKIKPSFIANLEAQGSTYEIFKSKALAIEKKHINFIYSKKSGYLQINLTKLRTVLVKQQNHQNLRFSDPSGVIFLKCSNSYVNKNEKILSFRNELQNHVSFMEDLNKCFDISESITSEPFELKIIGDA